MVVCVAVLFLNLACHAEYTKQHFHGFILYLSLGFVKGEENDSKCHWASAVVCQLDSGAWNPPCCFDNLSGFKMLVRRAGSCVSTYNVSTSTSAWPCGPDCREQGWAWEESLVLYFGLWHRIWSVTDWGGICPARQQGESLEWGMVSHIETPV